MAGPWEKYQATQLDTSGPWSKYAQSEPQAQPEQPGMLARGAEWVGRQLDRVPAGIRGYVEAVQTGDSYNAPNRAWQGLKDPSSVQSPEKMFERAGADTTHRERTIYVPPAGGPGPAIPMQINTSQTEDLAQLFNILAPTGLEVVPFGKAAKWVAPKAGRTAKVVAKGAVEGALGQTGVRAAERSILEKYSMAKAKEWAPTMGPGREIETVEQAQKAIEDAPKILAEKLKEHDLLYNPGKANFNLQRDLRKYGEEIGATIQEMKARDVSVNMRKVVDDYTSARIKALKESGKGAGEIEDFQTKILPKLQGIIDNLGPDELGNVPIDKAVAFRQGLQDMVKNWGRDASGSPLAQRVARELQYRANKAIEASDKMGPKLAALNDKFSDLKGLQPIIEDAYSRGFGRSAVGRDVRPLPFTRERITDRLLETVGSPVKSLMNARPQWADALANKFNKPRGLVIPEAASTVTPQEIQAIKGQFLPPTESPLPPRVPARRPLGEKPPTYIQRAPSVLDERLPPRESSLPRQRRKIDPVYLDPSLSVEELGKVMEADAAKEIASTKYQSDRLKTLWSKVKEAKTTKERTALMNLIRATHKATPKK